VPPLTVRANIRRGSADALLTELRERFPEASHCRFARDGLVLGRRGNPAIDPAFLAGRFTVQDEASQLVVALLDPQPGERVVDVCAAPGGKATAIAERVGETGHVVALDRHRRRLELVRRDARRLGLTGVETHTRDATRSLVDVSGETPFDRALVDAPCSGLGTLRRNPDARWRVRREDPTRLAEIQRQILRNAAALLRPGGTLVYSTCTLVPEENEEVVDAFLKNTPDFSLVSADELPAGLRPVLDDCGRLRCLPHRHDTDGFFAARLERRS
jgi:16S rRNA (cytosine967-C5)-methyltransferase